MRVVRVTADVPAIERDFDYVVPGVPGESGNVGDVDKNAVPIDVGTIVRVSLHGRRVRGWVVGVDVTPAVAVEKLRPIVAVSSVGPPAAVMDLCGWTARRFVGSPIALYRAASPANNVAPGSVGPPVTLEPGTPPTGTVRAIDDPRRPVVWWPPLEDRRAQVVSMLAAEGSSVVVTADPSRADALVALLRRHGWPAFAWHSDLPAAARTDAWRRAVRGGCVLVGGRTAAFAPLPDLRSVVVVDDLDDALQEERQPTWHAREVLAERCRRDGARFAVVSPLPSVVATTAATSVARPSAAVQTAGWPRAEVIDLGEQPPGTGLLSPPLAAALHARRATDGPALCLVNRRGRARLLFCPQCRQLSRWDREGLPLVDDTDAATVVGARPTVCLHCGQARPRLLRAGVERLGDELQALLGSAVRVGVVDAAVEHVDPDAEVLVGTEALLHRREVRRRRPSLVALLDFDQELFAPRVRTDEQALWLGVRAALLLAGRPRGATRFLIQTHAPAHPVVRALVDGELEPAQHLDIEARRTRRLPPFTAQALLTGDVPAVDAAVAGLRLLLGDTVTVKGPVGAGTKRRALVEHPDLDALTGVLGDVASGARTEGRLRIEMDPARA